MGYLLDSQWDNGSGIEDLKIWGTSPLFKFLDMFDEEYSKDSSGADADDFAIFLYYQMKNILLDMDEVIDRFIEEARNGRKTNTQSQDERLLSMVLAMPENKKDDLETYMRRVLKIEKTPETAINEAGPVTVSGAETKPEESDSEAE